MVWHSLSCLLVMILRPAKTDELIKMFRLWTHGSPRNHLLGGVADPPWVGMILGAKLVLAHTPLEVVRVVHMVSII